MKQGLDFPFEECAKTASKIVEEGGTIHQKWTCSHCGSRQTMPTPNTFYRQGECEECKKVTAIDKCNYVAMFAM